MSKPRLFRPTLIPFLLAPLAFGMAPPHPASGQGQVIPIQTLTELPAKNDPRFYAPPRMAPAKPLDIPDNVQIEEPFDWNRTDRYAAPDPDSFFPDDPEGGKQLDALFGGKLGGNHKPEDVFAVVRRGFRQSQEIHHRRSPHSCRHASRVYRETPPRSVSRRKPTAMTPG